MEFNSAFKGLNIEKLKIFLFIYSSDKMGNLGDSQFL